MCFPPPGTTRIEYTRTDVGAIPTIPHPFCGAAISMAISVP